MLSLVVVVLRVLLKLIVGAASAGADFTTVASVALTPATDSIGDSGNGVVYVINLIM